MRKHFLLIFLLLNLNTLFGQSIDGIYSGVWTNPNGFIYTVNAEIRQVTERNIEAKFVWLLNKASGNASMEYKLKQSVVGIEKLKGEINNNSLQLKGFEKIDEFNVIGLDEYNLKIDRNIISGFTKNNGDWKGFLKLTKITTYYPIIKNAKMYQPKSTEIFSGLWSGNVNSQGLAEGTGYFKSENFTYSGTIVNGKAEGQGYFRIFVPDQNGYYYAFGSWVNNNLTGWGHYEAPWKGVYEGEILNGLPNGKGIYYPPTPQIGDPYYSVVFKGDYHAGNWKEGALVGKAQQKISGILYNANCDEYGNCETEVTRQDEVSLLKIAIGVAIIVAIIDNNDDKLETGNNNKSSSNIFRRLFFKGLELYLQSQKEYNYTSNQYSNNLYESIKQESKPITESNIPKVKKIEFEQQISSFVYGSSVDKSWVQFDDGESGYIFYSNKYSNYYIWDGLANYWEYDSRENCINALYKYKTKGEISNVGKLK